MPDAAPDTAEASTSASAATSIQAQLSDARSRRPQWTGPEALSKRLPGQALPPDPFVEQPNAADLTYGWHEASSCDSHEQVDRLTAPPTPQDESGDDHAGDGSGEDNNTVKNKKREPTQAQAEEKAKADAEAQAEADEYLRRQQDMLLCRICFEGPGTTGEDGQTLGRLLSPCRCKGTMKYIHSSCLDSWRRFSSRSTSAVACDQCGAPYRFRKSRFVGVAKSRSLLFMMSIWLFLSLIWIVGVLASFTIERYGVLDDVRSAFGPAPDAPPNTPPKRTWAQWLTGEEEDDDTAMNDQYFYDVHSGSWMVAAGPTSFLDVDFGASWLRLAKRAVRAVVSGESTEAVKRVVLGDVDEEAQAAAPEEEEMGWWDSLVYDWKYGPSGFWPKEAASASGAPPDPAAATEACSPEASQDAPAATRKSEKWDARAATPAASAPRPKSKKTTRKAKAKSDASKSRWYEKLLLQCE